MINKIKYLFLLAICVSLIGGAVTASAQSDGNKTLVAGKNPLKQSDIEVMIEFHEWIFDTAFTSDERQKFQAYIEKEYRRDPAGTRRNTDTIAKSLAQVRQLDASKQKEVRDLTVSGYLDDLRKTSDDEDSQFLLGIYNRSKNSNAANDEGDSTAGKNSSRQSNSPRSGSTSASPLVGTWLLSTGVGGLGGRMDKMLVNTGTKTVFEFAADGTVNVLIESKTLSVMQCRINETTKISGTYSANGNELTMNLSGGTASGTNSCNRSENFNKKLSASTLKKTFVVKELKSVFRPDKPLILCLDGAEDEKCFQRDGK